MKQDQIIEAARQLFYKYGFKKVSMDEIAREAGVTKRTIYMYFSSKEELLKYFIEEELKNMKQIVEEIEKRKDLEFFESVNLGIYKLLKYKKEKDFLNIIAKEGEILKNEIILENLELIDKQIKEYIKEKLELAKSKGFIDYEDADITTFLIYKMYIALMFDWSETYKKLDDKVIADSILKFVLNGISRKEDDK